jgi:hypothetical protein
MPYNRLNAIGLLRLVCPYFLFIIEGFFNDCIFLLLVLLNIVEAR